MPTAVITGASGFIAFHLIRRLRYLKGWRLLLIDRRPLLPATQAAAGPDAKFIQRDIAEGLEDLVEEHGLGPEGVVIFHLAAETGARGTAGNILLPYLRSNVEGTAHVALLAARCRARLVFASSGAVHANPEERRPYAMTKRAGEDILWSFGEALDFGALRFSNVYGPMLEPKAVVGTFIQDIQQGRSSTVHGDGTQVRDFIYVEDIVRALIATAAARGKRGCWDIGTGRPTTVLTLLLSLKKLMWAEDHSYTIDAHTPSGALWSVLKAHKAKEELQWSPGVDLDHGLRKTIEGQVHLDRGQPLPE